MACRQRDELRAPTIEIAIATNEQRAGAMLDGGSERCVDLIFRAGNQQVHAQPKRLGRGPRFGLYGLRHRSFRVDHDGNRSARGTAWCSSSKRFEMRRVL